MILRHDENGEHLEKCEECNHAKCERCMEWVGLIIVADEDGEAEGERKDAGSDNNEGKGSTKS